MNGSLWRVVLRALTGPRRCGLPRLALVAAAAVLAGTSLSCAGGSPPLIVIASTTSLEDSGLLAVLLPAFEAERGIGTRLIAVGSGQALELGRRGDADVLLVHSPVDEVQFMANGHGDRRDSVMENDFVIVGPASDPAGLRGGRDGVAALRAVAGAGAEWVSRGDDSGTHRLELRLRDEAGPGAVEDLRISDVGQGMAETLTIASERGAYVLTDRATLLTLGEVVALDVLVEGDERLRNVYSVIVTRRARDAALAEAFADWLLSPAAGGIIAAHGTDRHGTALFRRIGSEP